MASPRHAAPRQVTPLAAVLLAPNPGPMTLEGTNTWLLRAPGEDGCAVVDPGPDDAGHLAAVAAAGGRVDVILLTHGHHDHSAGAATLHALTGAPVRALDPAHRLGSEGLAAGDVLGLAGMELRVLPTPGHTADSLSFLLAGDERAAPAVLTGDTILGRGSTVVAHPDGRLGDYLDSLRLLRDLGEATVLPGHGPELPAAGAAAERYLAHRESRLAQVRQALADAGTTPARADPVAVVRRVYADTDRALWPAAEMSVRAQLDYLREHSDMP
ncbi:putative hydrolase [Frankia canadensis]|uniref:Putative hydrolase n=1 Tax=Frankia canadensis TaxID=1836972 RepID=A0A2I2KY84_9ACTN|nr:MBL fold metallo-hydrolase [Frankia canadensis]SNQ50623.1 putative hydrolase [Frankia canadensis]SOU57913.1 putative hydrolase [Frankia canadensis]